MIEPREPARLLEAPEAALAELEPLLRVARSRGPSAEQSARMRAALGLPASADPAAAADAVHADAAASAGKARAELGAPTPTWLKLSLLVALGIGVAFLAQRERSERHVRRVATQPLASPPAPESRLTPPVVAMPEAEAARVVEPRTGTPARPHRAAIAVQAAEEPSAQPGVAGDPAAELALLKRAKAHARSAPERALALLAEHEQRFANGALEQEREVIAIEALLAGGDRDAAQQRSARFFERFADSAHARRVRALLGTPAAALSDTKMRAPPHPSR